MDREITLGDIGRSLWRGKWIILATTALAGVIGLLLTFVTTTTYTATSRVFLGQATSVSGQPVSTPGTNPLTAPTVLKSDRVLLRVSNLTGVPVNRIKDGISITIPRAPGTQAAGQPSVATLTMTDSDRAVARKVANGYADVVLVEANRGYQDVQKVYRTRLARLQLDQRIYQQQVRTYSAGLLRSAGTSEGLAFQSLLFGAQQQLADVRGEIDAQQLTIAKSEQIEAPQVVSLAETTSSSTSAPNRARTVLVAALIGLLIGIIVALVWRGGAPRRAERAQPAA